MRAAQPLFGWLDGIVETAEEQVMAAPTEKDDEDPPPDDEPWPVEHVKDQLTFGDHLLTPWTVEWMLDWLDPRIDLTQYGPVGGASPAGHTSEAVITDLAALLRDLTAVGYQVIEEPSLLDPDYDNWLAWYQGLAP